LAVALEVKDLEQIKLLIVDPVVASVRAEVAPLVARDEEQEKRIVALELNQSKALLGVAAAATALSVAFGFVIDWCRKKVGL
jgi:hypothetical protein